MKKLPICTLMVGALFVTFGVHELLNLKDRIAPIGLLFPLLWDIAMVGIGVGIILKADCSRKTGLCWCVFCVAASLAVGIAALAWILHPRYAPLGVDRMFFVLLAVVFGLVFGIWQLVVIRRAEAKKSDTLEKSGHPHRAG